MPSKKNLRTEARRTNDDEESDSDFDIPPKTSKRKKPIPVKEEKSPYFSKGGNGLDTKGQKCNYVPSNLPPKNIIHYLCNAKKNVLLNQYRETFRSLVIKDIRNFFVYQCNSPFSRKVSCLRWHPQYSNVLAVGSKSGDLFLWNIGDEDNKFIPGSGPDGTIKAMKFDELNPTRVYTASVNGTVCVQDFSGRDSQVYLRMDSSRYQDYYSALDVCTSNRTVVVGDTKGYVTMMTLEGQEIWTSRLHNKKVAHTEFSPRENWLLTTASLDRTVRMWDIRNMKNSYLELLPHEKAVNSAYFSYTDGCRLLTTDQHSQLRVYRGPLWTLENVIIHPHRQFQHLTSIKAQWHPLEDIIVVGRYPDPSMNDCVGDDLRAIDFFDAESGSLLYQLFRIGVSGIVSLNAFNHLGEYLASGMGMTILIWRTNHGGLEEKMNTRVLRPKLDDNASQDSRSKRLPRNCKKLV
ncbi:DNA damage-binding protein 2-like [Ischnura elegans]|uniref:DNA damage-binding protein 2-like n=1 Tax=Ischnura elegans TaxID=197161 RepID=UPI001ED878DF|nr:DNA damage-binding protein 2-like [Ischnura elegans]